MNKKLLEERVEILENKEETKIIGKAPRKRII